MDTISQIQEPVLLYTWYQVYDTGVVIRTRRFAPRAASAATLTQLGQT